jgi:hypothetical protein
MLVAGSNTITITLYTSHNSLQMLPAARKLASDAENLLKEIEKTVVSLF